MKKVLILLSMVSLIIFSSCGDDEDDNMPASADPGLSGTLTFNGNTYTMANGLFSLSDNNGNAEGIFLLADGTLTSTASGASSTDSKILISMTAVSKGTSTLVDGSYASSTNVPDRFIDVAVTVAGENQGQDREAFTGGTVTISGSGNTYSLTFDVPFERGITLTGSVSGTYEDR